MYYGMIELIVLVTEKIWVATYENVKSRDESYIIRRMISMNVDGQFSSFLLMKRWMD
jgi:hypothetical protein